MIFLSNKTHFSGWSRLLNNFNKIFMKKFLSENILSHCFLSQMLFRARKWISLAVKFILLSGHDCWKSLLKLQLYRAVLCSCPAKNSEEISFCNWSVKIFQFYFSTCLVKIVEGKLSERSDYFEYCKAFQKQWFADVLQNRRS